VVYLEPEVEVSCLSVNDSDDVSMAENNKLSSDDAKTDSDMHNDGAVLDSALDDANTNQRGSMYIFHIVYNLYLCALLNSAPVSHRAGRAVVCGRHIVIG